MPTFIINQSFFFGELFLPNLTATSELEKLNFAISKYEPECLLKIMGYPLYKAFGAETNQRMTDLLYGAEYKDGEGKDQIWQGLVRGNTIDYTHINPVLIKNDQQIKVGTTAGFNAGLTEIYFDGGETFPGSGIRRPDYRGWNIVPSELLDGRGILVNNLDYTWNSITGKFTLLQPGDALELDTYYNIHFEAIVPDGENVPDTVKNISLIANYIYFYFQRNVASQTSGIGTNIPKKEQGQSVSPADKMAAAWNFFSQEVFSMTCFLWLKKSDVDGSRIYPEFSYHQFLETRRISRKIDSVFSF